MGLNGGLFPGGRDIVCFYRNPHHALIFFRPDDDQTLDRKERPTALH
jgi:hypothetical protein